MSDGVCLVEDCGECGNPSYTHGIFEHCSGYSPEPCGLPAHRRWRFFGPLMCSYHGRIDRHPAPPRTPLDGGRQ